MALTRSLRAALALLLFGLTSSGTAAAEQATRLFALVVANNRSLSLSLPDLQYADDDGARYQRLFSARSDAARVELLTTFDRASEKLYSPLASAARPATRSSLLRAVAGLRTAVLEARARGEKTEFYFVFAGHGEVAGGRGYLHLEDTRIDGAFLEREVIEKIPADSQHLLLDSCNSFFVVNPRKPGGRRWATPKDMALGFAARHPEVGLFLSSNSDAEVFEWSEIESGVFSHEVRSGLSGAADVNQDGRVTYAELAGFVEKANSGISRETLRPQIYFRGPKGDRHAHLFSTARTLGRRLELGREAARVWIRGETGERLLDLNKEPGKLTVSLPASEGELSVFVKAPAAGSSASVPREYAIAAGTDTVRLAELPPVAPHLAARGHRLFGELFAAPYGPSAYAEFLQTEARAPEPVYGVTDADIARMSNYLHAVADLDRFHKRVGAISSGATGAMLLGLAAVGQLDKEPPPLGFSLGLGVTGAIFAGTGLYLGLSETQGESALRAFQSELADRRNNRALVFAKTESKLNDLAESERIRRQLGFWMMQVMSAGLASLATVTLLEDEKASPAGIGVLYGSAALMSGIGFYTLTLETPTERLLRLYKTDPALQLRIGIAGMPGGGMGLGLSGSF